MQRKSRPARDAGLDFIREDYKMSEFLDLMGIPLLIFVVEVYYGIRLLVLKDICAIRGKDKPPVKNKEMYAKWAGIILLLFAAATLVMIFLLLWNVSVAVAEIVMCILLLCIMWNKMNAKYGA